jgi:hypothetical protein
MEIIMENTYWNSNGTHQALANELMKLVPASGEIKGSKNKALDRFRKASNAYYDIFNNGGCNRGRSIGKFFEGVMFYIQHYHRFNFGRVNWDRIHMITEPKMDAIILAAAAEQGIA